MGRAAFVTSVGAHALLILMVGMAANGAVGPREAKVGVVFAATVRDVVCAAPVPEVAVATEPLEVPAALVEDLAPPDNLEVSEQAPQPACPDVVVGRYEAEWPKAAAQERIVRRAAVEEPSTDPAAASPANAPPPPTAALATAGSNLPPVYPGAARRRGWQGVVTLELTCDRDGKVVAARVTASSGYEILDEAAVAAVLAWRFPGGDQVVMQDVAFRLAG